MTQTAAQEPEVITKYVAPPIHFDRTVYHTLNISGTYAGTGGENGKYIEKHFRIEGVELDDEEVRKHGAVSTFLKVIAPEIMPHLYPDYVACLTFHPSGAKSFKNGKELDLPTVIDIMDRQQCLAYITDSSELSLIKPQLFEDISSLQQAIKDCKDDQASFSKQQFMLEKRKSTGPNRDKVLGKNAALIEKLKTQALNKVHVEPIKAAVLPADVDDDDLGI